MSHYKSYPAYKDSGVEWLGKVPEHWEALTLRRVVAAVKTGGTPSSESPSADISDGVAWYTPGDFRNDMILGGSEKRVSPTAISTGDAKVFPAESILVVSIGATLGKVGFVTEEVSANQQINIVIPNSRADGYFLAYSLSVKTEAMWYLANAATIGIMNQEKTKDIWLAIPSIGEQKSIATHLDRETDRIDALIEKKTRFIELLREKRQVLITHAVTKGLDPNVKMKDSGVEWLGEVPEHWAIKRFRDICTSISTGPFGTALGNEDYVTGGIPVINPSHIVNEQCCPDTDITVSAETAERLRFWSMRVGDLVTARRGELGRSAVISDLQDGWICGTGSLRVRPNSRYVLTQYLHTVLQSRYAREWLNLASVGATMANLNEGILGSLPLALPSVDEQELLLSSLAMQSERLIRVEQKASLSVDLLKERRSALITAAVTGQIDLREAV